MVIPCKSKKKKGMMVKLVASYSRESFKEMNRKGRNGLNTVNIEQGEFSRTVSRIRFYIVKTPSVSSRSMTFATDATSFIFTDTLQIK